MTISLYRNYRASRDAAARSAIDSSVIYHSLALLGIGLGGIACGGDAADPPQRNSNRTAGPKWNSQTVDNPAHGARPG